MQVINFRRFTLMIYTILLFVSIPYAYTQSIQSIEPMNYYHTVSEKMAKRAMISLNNGAAFLLKGQNNDGSWGEFKHPAITALCVMALHASSDSPNHSINTAINRGMAYVLAFIQEDGSIYPADRDSNSSANYPNYTTSIALLTIATLNRPEDRDVMIAARNYLQNSQFSDKSTVDFGGIGYGRTGRADLSNGAWAAEALYFSEYITHEPFVPAADTFKKNKAMWSSLQTFLTQCQNLPETNKAASVSKHPDDYGSFFYRPTESKAGTRKDGGLIGSGSMTYAGLKSMIYARMERSDIRVQGAIRYLMHNYTLKENPGMGMQGYYYYLHCMTKALHAYGADTMYDRDGNRHNWRTDVLQEFIALQERNGSWVNTHGRFMESIPELVTAYSMIAMKLAVGRTTL